MEPTLDFVKTIALHAGELLLSFVGGDLAVEHKSRTDLVTRADHASESYLIGEVQNAFPAHAINAEESGEHAGDADHRWFIDPLDGTLNYAHGVPIYCVSVAYAYRDQLQLGVIYDPVHEECFYAERGQGAFLNGRSMHVSAFEDLIDCMLVTGFPNDMWGTTDDNTANFFRFSKMAQTVRRLGSAALDAVYVAAGRLDGFWEVELCQWDLAAAALIIQEAGGIVTDIYGGSELLQPPVSVLAANPMIHAKMLSVLRQVRDERESR